MFRSKKKKLIKKQTEKKGFQKHLKTVILKLKKITKKKLLIVTV